MTKEEWKEFENEITPYFGRTLLVDGYEIFVRIRGGPTKYSYVCYVNGEIRGEWLSKDCEERLRFLRRVEKRVYSPAKIKKALEGSSKKYQKEFIKTHDLERTVVYYDISFPSVAAIRKQLEANNKSIEWIKK
jgi:hypothetical protein